MKTKKEKKINAKVKDEWTKNSMIVEEMGDGYIDEDIDRMEGGGGGRGKGEKR